MMLHSPLYIPYFFPLFALDRHSQSELLCSVFTDLRTQQTNELRARPKITVFRLYVTSFSLANLSQFVV